MFGFKSKRQVFQKPKGDGACFRVQQQRENPQAIGLGLTVYQETRSKKLIDLLHSQGYCIHYGRILGIETALANAVVERLKQLDGLYVPPFLKKGIFVFFAADNIDFAEDTPDGKNTTHGTITAVYQRKDTPGEFIVPKLCIDYKKNPESYSYSSPYSFDSMSKA